MPDLREMLYIKFMVEAWRGLACSAVEEPYLNHFYRLAEHDKRSLPVPGALK